MAPTHPTRSPLNTFYLDGDVVPRSETSPSQIHKMEERDPPIYMVSLGRCYRRDTVDATHFPIFHQVEGLAVDENLTLADLKGRCSTCSGPSSGPTARPGSAPTSSPSRSRRSRPTCRASCATARSAVLPSVRVDRDRRRRDGRPERLRVRRLRPEKVTGFAFGWGLERMALSRHGLPDIRALWENDLRLLEQF